MITPDKKPNILFLVLDGFRGDLCYGKKKTSKTPNIDKLIKNGTYFQNAISPGASSTPSVSSILTSLYPFESLVQDGDIFKIDPKISTHISELQKNGYDTHAIIQDSLHHIGFRSIFGQNLYTYDHANEKVWSGLGTKIIEKINKIKKSNPWFCYIQLYDLNLLIHTKNIIEEKGPIQIKDKKFGKNYYERIISAQDNWIGKIIDSIDEENTLIIFTADHGLESGAYDEELENFDYSQREKRNVSPGLFHKIAMKNKSVIPFRKKLAGKYKQFVQNKTKKLQTPEFNKLQNLNIPPYRKRLMQLSALFESHIFDDRIHVPLIFCYPNIPKEKKINSLVRSIDIFPSIFDLCNLKTSLVNRRGRSLKPLFSDLKLEELPIFIQSPGNGTRSAGHRDSNVVGIRTSEFKYFRDKDDPKKNINLFNLKEDPLEEYNIESENSNLVEYFERILERIDPQKNFSIKELKDDEDEIGIEEAKEIEKKLRDAGYIT